MVELYWICLGAGLAATLAVVLAGDALEGALDGALDATPLDAFLDPLSLVGGLTVFGGAGVLLDRFAAFGTGTEAALAALIGLAVALGLHFAYVRPMKRSENSTAFSVREYVGKLGEVNVAIPARGYGEVLVRMGASTTFQAAASLDGAPIATGTTVVVVEVEPDGTLHVAPFDEDEPPALAAPAPVAHLTA